MGYYTAFDLKAYCSPDRYAEVKEAAANSGNDLLKEFFEEEFIEAKWYDFEEDFKKFAAEFPDVLFIVKGDGEESEDIWEERFKGTDIEYHEMIMPPFTHENLLTESEKISRIMKEHSNN